LEKFAQWLSTTGPSVFIQQHEAWMIPTIQSVHIVGIGAIVGTMFMMTLRVLGWAGVDQTLGQTQSRFGPWLTGALWLLVVTGVLMVVGEPVRELVTVSFWVKMVLVAAIAVIAVAFRGLLRKDSDSGATKALAVLSMAILVCIILLGRFIAYDHVWAHILPAGKA